MWHEPVTNRTAQTIYDKSEHAYRRDAIQRIEINIQHLASMLGMNIPAKMWGALDFATEKDVQRILDNINTLREKVPTDSPQTPTLPCNTFQDMNVAEQILLDIYNRLEELNG